MAFVLSDRIKETTTTTGTGTYTLGGAVSGFETFTANLSNSDTTYYCCTDGTDFEVGLGTFTSSGTTLARTTIISSSNSNNAVNWSSGSRDIFCTLPGSKAVFKDASGHVNLSDNEEIKLGDSGDLRIFHNGTHSIIKDGGTGDLELDGSIVRIKNAGRTENMLVANANGSVDLYHDNSLRFTTTSTGAKVTGGAGDGTLIIEADTDNATEEDNALLQLIQDGGAVGVEFGLDSSNSIFIKGTGASGNMEFKHGDENLAILKADGAAELYHDNSKKFETTSSGATVTGTLSATLSTAAQPNITSLGTLTTLDVDSLTMNGNTLSSTSNVTVQGGSTVSVNTLGGDITLDSSADINLDANGADIKFKDNGTEFLRISNSSSDAIIKPIADGKDIIFQQRDGTEVARVEDNGTFNVVTDKLAINGTAITSTAAEINKLDGVTATTTELNYVDVTTLGTVQASKAVTADANGDVTFPDNENLFFGNGSDFKIFHNGSNSFLRDQGTGALFVQTSRFIVEDLSSNRIIDGQDGGQVDLYYDGSKKFETTTTGATVTGDLTTDEVFIGNTTDHKIGKVNHTYGDGIGLTTDSGTVTIGQANSSYSHYINSNDVPHWFNKQVYADGGFRVWSTNDNLTLKNGGVVWDGATSDSNTTTLNVTDPTADRFITLPNATGTVLTTGNSDTPTTTTSSSDADFVLVDDGGTMKKITPSNLGITSGGASKGFAVAMAIAL